LRRTKSVKHSDPAGEDMKARTIVLTLVLYVFGLAVCFASNPNMGTWKLNEAKSTFAPGATKNHTVVYEAAGDKVKVTTDGTTSDGKHAHTEWTGKFEGKDYPVTGDPTVDTRSYKKINDRTMELTNKKGGKVITSGRIVVSPDGKSRTVTITRSGSEGMAGTSTAVYDKE
jgi:hypothetical protein